MTLSDQLWQGRGARDCLVLDAHAHLGRWQSFFTPDPTPEQMIREMDLHGIDATIVSSLQAIACDLQGGNSETLRVLKQHPGRFYGYVVLNPHRPIEENREELRRCFGESDRFVGIKLHSMWHRADGSGPEHEPLWEMAAEREALVLVHCWLGDEEPEQFAAPRHFALVAERFPQVHILLGHSGGTRRGHHECAAICKRLPNVSMDICASEFSGMWIEELLSFAPADRVLFASDSPFLGVGSPIGRVGFAAIPEETKHLVYGGNIARLLRQKAPWAPLPEDPRPGGNPCASD